MPTPTTCGSTDNRAMNVLLFDASDQVEPGVIELRDQRLLHLRDVQNMQVGQTLKVGMINGWLGWGEVRRLDSEHARIHYTLDRPPDDKLPLNFVIALPRPKMLRRIVRTIAECGAQNLHLINSYRVQKSYWQTPVLKPETTRRYLLEGLSQAIDTVLPEVHLHTRFRPFVEDSLPGLIGGGRALLAQPGSPTPCHADTRHQTLCVIGPEGGFTPFELDLLQAAGCQPVHLGIRVLRVDTALPVLLGRLGGQ